MKFVGLSQIFSKMLKTFVILNFLNFLAKMYWIWQNFDRTLMWKVRMDRSLADRAFQLRREEESSSCFFENSYKKHRRAPSVLNWTEFTQVIKPKCRVCDRYLECRRCRPALGWKVRSARDRTIRTFHIRVRSKFVQNPFKIQEFSLENSKISEKLISTFSKTSAKFRQNFIKMI